MKVDGSAIPLNPDSGEYKAGSTYWTGWSVGLENLQTAGLTDFQELSLIVTGTLKDGTEIFEKKLSMKRDAFESLAEGNDTTVTENTKDNTSKEEEETQETVEAEKDSDIEERLSALEKGNKELEEKNRKLEEEKKELEKKIKELEEKETQEAKVTETPASEGDKKENNTPEPTQLPEIASGAETKNVVEYKDAATIRIVQQSLNDAGYNCGTPDGVAGGNTTQAITKYQTEKGLTANGLVTDELLQSLGVVEKVQEAVKLEASKAEYSSDYTYDQLSRNPDTYMNQKMKFTGVVVQTGSAGDNMTYARVKINSNIDTVLFVTYYNDLLGYRLLDDDNITIYGKSMGVYSYSSVGAGTITLPWIQADMIEMQ